MSGAHRTLDAREALGLSVQVHEGGDGALDGIFRLIALADRPGTIEEVLTEMCGDVAAIARADVASVYVREEREDGPCFTMRGNVGFPREAVGRVHLRPGEGITGFTAERLRPVSVGMAPSNEHFKYIPGLGEERFPALLAVPILRGGAAAGVLVLQRREAVAFTNEEVVVASALAAVINHALERGEDRAWREALRADRRAARLSGTAIVAGAAMGHAELLPTLTALERAPAEERTRPVKPRDFLKRLASDLGRAGETTRRAAEEIATLALILEDERFVSRLIAACEAPDPLKALSATARAYARVPFDAPGGDGGAAALLAARAAEIEELCVLVYTAASGRRPLVRGGAVVVAEQLRLFSTLYAISAGVSGFAIDAAVAPDGAAAAFVRAAGLPLVAALDGVFAWLHPGDLVVVDGDAAMVRVNPPASAVARLRNDRR